ncbi:MAG: lysophospholipid acyltransferase family protein [Chloroflexota bacterium]|nr:1-acyl-sn-glycerol-3-phosphate acyltransferase [Dehalococcoidia bacterium]MDW8253195.1 lysophospholipid acyltransferase family protein [Chloroflexota bacterium]
MSEQVARLTEIALDDLVEAVGWLGRGVLRPVVRLAGRRPARQFAEEVAAFDQQVARDGLVAAARSLLARHVGSLQVRRLAAFPAQGPVLIVANHPGLTDALALIVAMGDDALILVAADRPFFRALPHTLPSLLLVPDDGSGRIGAFRAVARRLAEGRRVATFPSGTIDPDPLLHADAFSRTAGWSRQLTALRLRLPALSIVPVAIGGVLTRGALRHPLARLYRPGPQRERAAAMLQVVDPRLRPAAVRLVVGPPLAGTEPEQVAQAYSELASALRAERDWSEALGSKSQPAASR